MKPVNSFAERVVAYLEKQEKGSGRLPHLPVMFSPDQVRKAIIEVQRLDALPPQITESQRLQAECEPL